MLRRDDQSRPTQMQRKYLILDANVVASYYLPRASTTKVHKRAVSIVGAMKD